MMSKITVILEGKEYQIDIEKAKELGVLNEKDTRCKSWEEFKNKYKYCKGVVLLPDITENNECYFTDGSIRTSEQLTKEEAIAISAFSKLLKLRRDWIGDWEPDWTNGYVRKYYIFFRPNNFYIDYHYDYSRVFSFPTKEMAEEFLNCFRELFEQCKFLI